MKTLITIAAYLLFVANADAATFTVLQSPPYVRDAAAIVINGTINEGDDDVFFQFANQVSQGVVMLNSNGGNLQAGLNIAKDIRRRGHTTWVGRGSMCASICSVIWLSGEHAAIQRNSLSRFPSSLHVRRLYVFQPDTVPTRDGNHQSISAVVGADC